MSTTKNNSSVNLSLTEQQVNLIIESLLFSSSVNIGAEWNEADLTSMIDTAKALKKVSSNIELNILVFYKEDNYEDKWTKDLLKFFKKNLKTLDLQKA